MALRLSYRTVTCPKCGGRVSFWCLASVSAKQLREHVAAYCRQQPVRTHRPEKGAGSDE